ncbi:uncharacterized protein ATC70_007177 [Mucor velutinosus]|uniref:Uncharacterized protein n=1 Tax=Mucor velutinosus TaxID=708070 RepID=A0AAN7HW01_9FUNG|nr:hypothetical protein ATC70_007177 [Mucor velutinosus]
MKLSFSLAILVATIATVVSADSIDDKPNKWCMIKGGKCGEGIKKCCPGRVCLPSQKESDPAGTTRCYIGEEEEDQ